MGYSIVDYPGGRPRELGSFLMPPDYNTGYTSPDYTYEFELPTNALYRYTADDITAFGHKFDELKTKITEHRTDCFQSHDGKIPLVQRLISEAVIPDQK